MITLLAFLVAIGVLVTFHEFGHYLVARLAGVKVLRFSIGLGKPLWSRQIGETEWMICPIPLGGYVKMLDEREGRVDPPDLPRAFNRQPPVKRIAIVAAGPLANFVLAAVLYWFTLVSGVDFVRPWVGSVSPQTPAAVAGFQPGDRLLTLNGVRVENWQDVRLGLMQGFAAADRVSAEVVTGAGRAEKRVLDIARFDESERQGFMNGQVGLSPFKALPLVGAVQESSPAERAGFKPGDKLLAVNGTALASWEAWVDKVRNSPGQEMAVTVERTGKPLTLKVRPDSIQTADGYLGRIGVGPLPDPDWSKQVRGHLVLGPVAAVGASLAKTWSTSWVSLKLMGWMAAGRVSWSNLSGPITIASVAGQSAQLGWVPYLEFLALISISIGILNLLPIPVLDGGHLMYYTAELIKGRPLSDATQRLGERIGLILLFGLMLFALFNDLSRLFGG